MELDITPDLPHLSERKKIFYRKCRALYKLIKNFSKTNIKMEKQILIPEVLLCSLCKNLYTDPRILSCQHSFCHPCLTNSLKSGFIQCHRCDFPNQIENLDALPKDDLITLTIETLQLDNSTVKCQECEKKDAKIFCENCNSNLCEECSTQKIHNSNRLSKYFGFWRASRKFTIL